ncbi:uncharacterized protein LOC119831332 [Zerene cesonia]|uniref:uncharacterized protein LOC119831332 n=1 Tax=Zerene cesonia TaxID=33412 RepID=UPI0018E55F52|nr:uncharacterized protein LOC119831332 [Zerene cesonia]
MRKIQVAIGLIAILGVVTCRPHFLPMKFKISGDAHLSIPVFGYQIGNVPNVSKQFLAPPILDFGRKPYKDVAPVQGQFQTKGSEATEINNYYQHTTADTAKLAEKSLNDVTSSTDIDTETTTETYTTTDIWTTTEDFDNYDDTISNRISPQVVASLLG